ncbi:MAG: glutathione peroxidase [Myxococcota bacterium]
MPDLFDTPVTTIDGEETTLDAYRGRVLLIVNTASQCGFTPQYEGLEALYRRHRDHGLTVLGFPCDQFGHQEPGDEDAIKDFCATRFSVSFPMFAKIDVNGPSAHPLYRRLKRERPGLLGTERIKWNFTKFAVDRAGAVVGRYAPTTTPAKLDDAIRRWLDAAA